MQKTFVVCKKKLREEYNNNHMVNERRRFDARWWWWQKLQKNAECEIKKSKKYFFFLWRSLNEVICYFISFWNFWIFTVIIHVVSYIIDEIPISSFSIAKIIFAIVIGFFFLVIFLCPKIRLASLLSVGSKIGKKKLLSRLGIFYNKIVVWSYYARFLWSQ